MIANELELTVTRAKLSKLKEAQKLSLQNKPSDVDPRVYQGMLNGLQSLVGELESEITEYEQLKKTPFKFKGRLEDLPSALIKARIARDLTQEELAKLLHVKAQQIQRYEKTQYAGISFHRIIEIAKTLRLEVETDIHASEKKP